MERLSQCLFMTTMLLLSATTATASNYTTPHNGTNPQPGTGPGTGPGTANMPSHIPMTVAIKSIYPRAHPLAAVISQQAAEGRRILLDEAPALDCPDVIYQAAFGVLTDCLNDYYADVTTGEASEADIYFEVFALDFDQSNIPGKSGLVRKDDDRRLNTGGNPQAQCAMPSDTDNLGGSSSVTRTMCAQGLAGGGTGMESRGLQERGTVTVVEREDYPEAQPRAGGQGAETQFIPDHVIDQLDSWTKLDVYANRCLRTYIEDNDIECFGFRDKIMVEIRTYFQE